VLGACADSVACLACAVRRLLLWLGVDSRWHSQLPVLFGRSWQTAADIRPHMAAAGLLHLWGQSECNLLPEKSVAAAGAPTDVAGCWSVVAGLLLLCRC